MSSRKLAEIPSTPRYLHHLAFCHGCSPESPRGNLITGRWYIYAVVLRCQVLIIRVVHCQLLLSFIISHHNHDWSRTSNHGHRGIFRLLAHSRRVRQKGKGSCSQGRFQTHALLVGYDCTQVRSPLELNLISQVLIDDRSYLDRNALPNARIQGIEEDLGLKGDQFNTAISVLFAGYIALQIPSNMLLTRVRPSIYLVSCLSRRKRSGY